MISVNDPKIPLYMAGLSTLEDHNHASEDQFLMYQQKKQSLLFFDFDLVFFSKNQNTQIYVDI